MYTTEIQNWKYKQYRKPSINLYQSSLYKEIIDKQRQLFYELIKGYQEKQKEKHYNFKINNLSNKIYN